MYAVMSNGSPQAKDEAAGGGDAGGVVLVVLVVAGGVAGGVEVVLELELVEVEALAVVFTEVVF